MRASTGSQCGVWGGEGVTWENFWFSHIYTHTHTAIWPFFSSVVITAFSSVTLTDHQNPQTDRDCMGHWFSINHTTTHWLATLLSNTVGVTDCLPPEEFVAWWCDAVDYHGLWTAAHTADLLLHHHVLPNGIFITVWPHEVESEDTAWVIDV